MVKRRTTILGIGALAGGSGAAFTSAALTSTTTPGAEMDIYAVADLQVSRGADDWDSDFSISDQEDLPDAHVDESTDTGVNGDLVVNTANLIEGSSDTLEHLLEVANNGDTTEDVAFGYDSFDLVVSEDNTAGSGEVDRNVVQDVYTFKVNDTKSPQGDFSSENNDPISPPFENDANDPANYVTLEPGDVLAVDLEFDASGSVSELREVVSDPTGNPFTDDPVANQTLIDSILVGLDGS